MVAGYKVASVHLQRGLARDLPTRGWDQCLIRRNVLSNLLPLRQRVETQRTIVLRIDDLSVCSASDCWRSMFHCAAASPISVSRAAAATLRSCRFIVGVVRLPNVPISNGVSCVSPITISILFDRNMKLFGNRLAQRGPDVLSHLCFPGIDGDPPVFSKVQPGPNFFGQIVPLVLRLRPTPAPPLAGFNTEMTRTPAPRNLKKSRRSRSKR